MTTTDVAVAIALGSNLGDRQGNVVAALQRMRAFVRIDRISSAYLTTPVGYAAQPEFLNLTCTGHTALSARELRDGLLRVERLVGRSDGVPLGPRAIDLDLLLYGDAIVDEEDLQIPHHGLTERPFVLVPLAEIAPNWVEPTSGETIAAIAGRIGSAGVRRSDGGLLPRLRRDIQQSPPAVPLTLDRAGVTGVRALVTLPEGFGRQRTAIASFDIFAELDAERSGVHMSRFSQDIEDVLADVGFHDSRGIGSLAKSVAERVIESQGAQLASVDVRAEIALPRHTPASALPTHEFYTLLAKAVVAPSWTRSVAGVEAAGITACPCAQAMVADSARERLAAGGFSDAQIAAVLAALPVATHNQRGVGTLMVGSETEPDIAALVEIVEQSMSSETYDLLKRPDELFVVNKAHFHARFVEDVVREMLRYAAAAFDESPDDTFLLARQVNFESIHKHDAEAQCAATLGELRRELRGETGVAHTSLERWLYPRRAAQRH